MKKLYPIGVIVLLFMVGIGFILYPSIGNLVTLNTASVTISDYAKEIEEADDSKVQELFAAAEQFNRNLYYGIHTEEEAMCLNNENGVICYLDIPKIDVYLPVYFGTSDEVLKKGCGYIENTSLPTGGETTHSALSGHTGLPGAVLLSDLDQMEEQDIFYVHILGEIHAYLVDMIKVIEPHETEDLEIRQGQDYISLITCTPYGINSHRLLVRGIRTEYVEETIEEKGTEYVPQNVSEGLSDAVVRQIYVIAAIVLLALLLVLLAVWYSRRVKKWEKD